ncbi:MAG: U32 family peptidase [SAR324 cluster bacterium]|nr:U32 family peptidase [SAR324 cluster bacterium]
MLAPAGNLEKLKIAILYGADAVYVAGPQFSLRAGTDNFSNVELQAGVAFAHEHDAKVYVTLNAFLHDAELEKLPDYVEFLDSAGVDAVIASDPGVIHLIQEHSSLPIHLSTQASCLNQFAAKLWKNLGVRRVVLGREVSIEQAGLIRKNAGIEVELFIHGSMCMSYSGNCTISNYTAARDSNRGGCVQSCRFSYSIWERSKQREEGMPPLHADVSFMSSKDLRGLELIPHFVEAQITSLKIEGRMKSNLYVATTVLAYSKALECFKKGRDVSEQKLWELSQELEKISHRQYTDASLLTPAGPDSIYAYSDRTGKHNSSYEIAGTVLEVFPEEYITLLVQNPFNRQNFLEVLTFDGQMIVLPAKEMKDVHHQPISAAQPNRIVLLPCVDNIRPLNLARKPIPPEDQVQFGE